MELLTTDSDNTWLKSLEFWVEQEAVTLLIPEVIKDKEWPNIRRVFLDDVRKANKKTIQTAKHPDSPISALVTTNYTNLESIVFRTEALMNRGKHYKASKTVKAFVTDRLSDNKAPFHNKSKSHSDPLIFFSTAEHIRKSKKTDLVFITTNHKDFSEPADHSKLHPDLALDRINIRYFTTLHLAIHTLKGGLLKPPADLIKKDKDYVSIFFLSKNIEALSPLDQALSVLQSHYDQIPYIPLNILNRVFPFNTSTNAEYSFTLYSAYELRTNNKELFDALKSAEKK